MLLYMKTQTSGVQGDANLSSYKAEGRNRHTFILVSKPKTHLGSSHPSTAQSGSILAIVVIMIAPFLGRRRRLPTAKPCATATAVPFLSIALSHTHLSSHTTKVRHLSNHILKCLVDVSLQDGIGSDHTFPQGINVLGHTFPDLDEVGLLSTDFLQFIGKQIQVPTLDVIPIDQFSGVSSVLDPQRILKFTDLLGLNNGNITFFAKS